jgi:hypothetical protein
VAAFGPDLDFLDAAAEEPCPDSVGQFVAEDVDPHRLGEEQENDNPASRACEHGEPDAVRPAGLDNGQPERVGGSDAHGQQQNPQDHFDPFRHGASIGKTARRSEKIARGTGFSVSDRGATGACFFVGCLS